MKVLHYHAVSGNPRAVPALLGQIGQTLRPFSRYLSQAIHTAKQRQVRYALPWRAIPRVETWRLEPLDTWLRVPRLGPSVHIVDWPVGLVPDLSRPAMVVSRDCQVRILKATPAGAELEIETSPPLEPGDQVFWAGRSLQLRWVPAPPPPAQLQTLAGQPLTVLAAAREDGDSHWRVGVAGIHPEGSYLVDGQAREAAPADPWEEVTHVTDAAEARHAVQDRCLHLLAPPAEGPLVSNTGMRFAPSSADRGRQHHPWVELLPPAEGGGEDAMDPRVAFCEDQVEEVWTSERRRPDAIIKVYRVDRDRFRLQIERLPPEGSRLFLPLDLRNLHLQKRALKQLSEAPLPHHRGLLRLCESPDYVRWPDVRPRSPGQWLSLTDPERSGTQEQRRFVEKALGTPDLALLEGPPGSGKTTAICEIIRQLVRQGERVLLCASTHVAIDNVLERLLAEDPEVDAVRIGKLDRVDDAVRTVQLDARVDALVERWQRRSELSALGTGELRDAAERTVILAANLTCGTTMGIVSHPLFSRKDEDLHVSERPITTWPHWDVLIVDEASKTLIQEFMVPALMARRHIVVGDVRQLPPFTERADLVANLRELVDDQERPIFSPDHQRACWLRWRLERPELRDTGLRWLVVEPRAVLDCLEREVAAGGGPTRPALARIDGVARPTSVIITPEQLRKGAPEALWLMGADWVLVPTDLLEEVADRLPADLLPARSLDDLNVTLPPAHPLRLRQSWWHRRAPRLRSPYPDAGQHHKEVTTSARAAELEQSTLARGDLAQELAWRLTRIHELRYSHAASVRARLEREVAGLSPRCADISGPLSAIQDIGLPSILEVLQEGIGAQRSNRRSSLTEGFRRTKGAEFQARFESLSYQHRMHPQIAAFPRQSFYVGQALKDANTVAVRDAQLRWSGELYPHRAVWVDVDGREVSGENPDEIAVIREHLLQIFAWVKRRGAPDRAPHHLWEIACLSFYAKQERALSQMLRQLTGEDRQSRFRVKGLPVEITCGTVDRFQGREADVVFLSMRNTRRVGFLDSPNRLNVAITRARQQLVIVGNARYFRRCRTEELEALANQTYILSAGAAPIRRSPWV